VIVTSKDENLTKAHGRYLESRFIQITTEAQRAKLANSAQPEVTALPEPDVADMEYFLNQVQMLLPVLGFSFAMPLPTLGLATDTRNIQAESPLFRMTYSGVEAFAQEIGGEFVVFKGSTARMRSTPTLADPYIQMRSQLCKDGKLMVSDNPEYWIFTQNVPFSSTSTAANVVAGAQLNGRTTWKVKDTGATYAEWQELQTALTDTAESD
jgi:hypothetical protein